MGNKNKTKKQELNKKVTRVKDDIKVETKKEKSGKKIWKFILVIVVILIIFFIYQTLKLQKLVSNIINFQNSTVLDIDGNAIAVLGSERYQEKTTIDKVPNYLKNAYIAIEDKRFEKHHGVDIKRTGGAILSFVKNRGNASFGGSTITQQFVKNVSGDNESSITRKVQEWFRAWQIEIFMDKDEILEGYFNVIYVGPNVYGVKLGARYYFNKELENMSLAECAFLAGLNHSPNSYNPFAGKDNGDLIKKRTKIVLTAMKDQQFISEEEYNTAIAEVDDGLNFQKGELSSSTKQIYSYHTDALINELIDDISKREFISKEFAKNYIYLSGFKIYSTQKTEIQDIINAECKKPKYILASTKVENATTQVAVVIIDHSTGHVLGCSGGLGEKTNSRAFNRATQTKRQTGSAGKPIAVLAPALVKKIITPSTIYVDEETTFDDGKEGYTPTDYNGFQGKMTVRRAVESSQNIPFVKIMEQLTPRESIKFMRSLGITSLTDVDDNLNLALGGLDKGISPLEMAGAYSAIANDGEYLEPTFYTKIENKDGAIVVKNKQAKRKVFSKQVAYVLKNLLKQPVEGQNGTAIYCKINNMDVAAKTGTTNENYDRWLCGFTNYYTTVTWFGYDMNERINYSGNNPAGVIWSEIMKKIHLGLPASSFEKPKGIVELAVCLESGEIATHSCTNTYTEVFTSDNIPGECSIHSATN